MKSEETVERVLTQQMKIATLAHFQNGVPIARLGLNEKRKNMLARVEHVYWLKIKNPFLDSYAMFREMAKERVKDPGNATHQAKAEEKVLQFVIENSAPPSRKEGEMKVRAASDRLMRIGMESDNDRALAKGAEIRMKLDRLDQPESEQSDMSKAAFLPSVVVTDIREVDQTKEYIDDEESKRIMQKYGGYVDEKRKMIEDQVEVMEARHSSAVNTE